MSRGNEGLSHANAKGEAASPPCGKNNRYRTRRSSSASDLTRCSRFRMACPKMDWGGTSRLPPLSSPSIDRTTYSRSSRRRA